MTKSEEFFIGDMVFFTKNPQATDTGVVHPLDKEYFISKIERGLAYLSHVPNGKPLMCVPLERITHHKIPTDLWEHLEDQGEGPESGE